MRYIGNQLRFHPFILNIELEKMPLAFNELMKQALGEFEDKFATRDLKVVVNIPEP